MTDLDGRTLDDFRRRGFASGRLPPYVLNESDSNLIEMLRLREGEYLRRAAVLLFHPDPARFFAGAFVNVDYFRAEAELAYQDVIEGNLFVQVDRVVDLLRTKYSKARISYEGIYRRETPPAPSSALHEAVINAIVHRDYSNPAPIQIRVFDDRIELWNPGALPLGWTVEELLATHASAPQNPVIANVFFRAGMIEAWGRGIADIVRSCRAAATAEPRWDLEPGGLRLEFVFAEAGDEPQPRNAAQATARERGDALRKSGDPAHDSWGDEERQPESQPESLAERVLRQLAGGPMSKADLSRILGQRKVSGQFNKVIRLLAADGRIERTMPERPQSRLQRYRLKN